MSAYLSSFYVASALGAGLAETRENYARKSAPGLSRISGDIPSREIYFGRVLADLPKIRETRWNIRTNQLLELALASDASFANLVARYGAARVAIVLGASNTGVDEAENYIDQWLAKNGGAPDANFDFSFLELGTPSLYLKERLGVKGPCYTVSTACSSATKAFGAAQRLLEKGVCDAVITGGVDGRCRFAMNGFHALGALSEGLCRPLAPDRDGINLGEGVALFTMERENFATASRIRVCGVGESSDAYHTTAPDPSGAGAARAMQAALDAAGLTADAIVYLNLHGTGTRANDDMEMLAVEKIFGARKPACIESTKNLTGHCLGAAGAVEAAICAMRLLDRDCQFAMSNSFAFGGSNASVILGRDQE